MTRRVAIAAALLLSASACSKCSGRSAGGAASSAPAATSGAREHRLTTGDGRARRYFSYVPTGLTGDAPLLLVLHGGGGNAEGVQTTAFTHAAADRHGFVVLYPEGIGDERFGTTMATWNGGYCCGRAAAEGVDDVAALAEILSHFEKEQRFDRARVFATGISNGGIMATRLACERPDLVAAIAAVGSPGYLAACDTDTAVAVQIIHGTDDRCALFDGGGACGGCWERALGRALGIPIPARTFACAAASDQVAFWREVNGCSERARVTHDQGKARCVEYDDCASGKPVSFCRVDGGGHTWPGSARSCDPARRGCQAFGEVTGAISRDLDANDAMAAFFARSSGTPRGATQ